MPTYKETYFLMVVLGETWFESQSIWFSGCMAIAASKTKGSGFAN